MDIKISEKDLEDYLVASVSDYYPDYQLIDRQVKLGAGIGIADVVLLRRLKSTATEGSPAMPENDVEITHKINILVLELKIGQAIPNDIGQLARYVMAISDVADMEILSHNHETHVFEFSIEGLIVSPDITFDALAMCMTSDCIAWQPYTISLEKGFELSDKWQFCMADCFDFDAESNVIMQCVETVKKDILGVQIKKEKDSGQSTDNQ